MSVTGFSASNYLGRSAVVTAAPFLLFAWVKLSSTASAQTVVTLTQNGSANNQVDLGASSSAFAELKASGASAAGVKSGVGTGSWIFIAGRYDSNVSRRAYLGSTAGTANTTDITPTSLNVTTIGAMRKDTVQFPLSAGIVAHAGIYDLTGMSSGDVDTLISNLAAGHNPLAYPTGLAAYWPLTDSSTLSDSSGNGRDLTMTGTITTGTGDPTVDAPPSAGLNAGTASETGHTTTTADLTCGAASGGTPTYTYQWYRSTSNGVKGSAVSGAISVTLDDTGLTNSTDYYYTLEVTDSASPTPATDDSNQVHVTTSAPPALTAGTITVDSTYGLPRVFCSKANLTCSAATGGTGSYTYQWYRSETTGFTPGEGNILAGKTSLTLADSGMTRGTTYFYKLVVDDGSTAATTTQASITTKLYNVMCDGDSLTYGLGHISSPNSYPEQLAGILGAAWAVTNKGVGGQRLDQMQTDASTDIDPYLDSQALLNICVAWGGGNDIGGGASAATVHSRMDTYCSARQAAGWEVLCVLMPPADSLDAYAPIPADANNLTRADWADFADGIVDFAVDARLADPDTMTVDGTHFTAAGYGIIAGNVAATIVAVLNGMGPEGAAPAGVTAAGGVWARGGCLHG